MEQVSNDVQQNNSIKSDISVKVTSLLDENPDDALKTNIAIALVDFYVEKIKGKKDLTFGTPEYDACDDKLRTWEDIIEQCLPKLKLKKLVGSDAHKLAELQRNLATYFPYSDTT